jgi:uncharacterized membrane protein
VVALGVETVVCARLPGDSVGDNYPVIPVIPWLPAIPFIAFALGSVVTISGIGLLLRRTRPLASVVVGCYFFTGALVLCLPRYAVNLGSMPLRTGVFEPLSLAALAFLMSGIAPIWLVRVSRYALGLSLVVFGVDHLIAVMPIASLVPKWIPGRPFWVAFFGVVFIAAGLSIWLKSLEFWAASGLGLMFASWVCTLHLPRVLGIYHIPGAPQNPNEWGSLFIAIALWGGPWVLAGRTAPEVAEGQPSSMIPQRVPV